MSERYDDLVSLLREAVLAGGGVTQPGLRQAVASRAAAPAAGSPAPNANVPRELVPLVDKIAQRAFTVTDADVQALLQQGYTEDAVFEIAAAAALGAGLGRLERGLAALKGRV